MKEMLISGDELNSLWLKAFRRELFLGDDTDYSSLAGVHCGEDKVQLFYPLTQAANILYIPNCLYSYYYRTDSTIHSFDVRDISRKLSQEMFSVLSLYMERWGMNDRRHQQLLALYQLRMYLSVYFGVRKSCATARERQILRKYPWGGIEKQWSPYYSEIRCRLSVCERIKLLAAALRL